MIGRNSDSFSTSFNFASTDRLACKYLFIQSGARYCSICGPPAISGHPASAAEVNTNGKSFPTKSFALTKSVVASIALKAESRVIESYVDSESGTDPLPETNWLKLPRPEASSNNSPIQWTTPEERK